MLTSWKSILSPCVAVALVAFVSPASAPAQPWDLFQDGLSDSVCDVVNAQNAELVVLSDTGQLVIVSGTDTILQDTLVDLDGFVYYMGDEAGLIEFATDDDGFRTLWWMTLAGHVVEVDEFTGQPYATDLFPEDIGNVPCDACPFWDDPLVCADDPVDDDDIFPPITFNICGVNSALTMTLTAAGLGLMRMSRRRRR